MMTEVTPAWREAYVRIANELVRRHRSFWASIDWNTLIGPDPGVDRYPPEMLAFIPEKLRGRYAAPGWTGNGIEPRHVSFKEAKLAVRRFPGETRRPAKV